MLYNMQAGVQLGRNKLSSLRVLNVAVVRPGKLKLHVLCMYA